MRKHALAVMVTWGILLLASGCTAEDKAGANPELTTLKDKVSYAIGLNIGKDFKQQDIDVDPNLLARGIKDAVSGAKPLLTEEQMQETITAFKKEMVAKHEAKTKGRGRKEQEGK